MKMKNYVEDIKEAIPSTRHISDMDASPLMPSNIILIFSSDENFLRACLLISFTTASELFLGPPIFITIKGF